MAASTQLLRYARSHGQQIAASFLGESPAWYKRTIVGFLIANPFALLIFPYLLYHDLLALTLF